MGLVTRREGAVMRRGILCPRRVLIRRRKTLRILMPGRPDGFWCECLFWAVRGRMNCSLAVAVGGHSKGEERTGLKEIREAMLLLRHIV